MSEGKSISLNLAHRGGWCVVGCVVLKFVVVF